MNLIKYSNKNDKFDIIYKKNNITNKNIIDEYDNTLLALKNKINSNKNIKYVYENCNFYISDNTVPFKIFDIDNNNLINIHSNINQDKPKYKFYILNNNDHKKIYIKNNKITKLNIIFNNTVNIQVYNQIKDLKYSDRERFLYKDILSILFNNSYLVYIYSI
jgi:hypothetical protein